MAGIGFALRRLTQRDDLLGLIQAYAHSALASTGPWLFTILCLAGINFFAGLDLAPADLATFRLIIMYNFAFSLVFSGPLVMVCTRGLADLIYSKEVEKATGILMGGLVLLLGSQLLVVVPFYFFVVDLPAPIVFAAIINYALVACVWLVAIFLTALKAYLAVTGTFAMGMAISMAAAVYIARISDVAGMLIGFSAGLAFIVFGLLARILAEYPYEMKRPFAFLGQVRRYWMLAASGLVYNAAIWADKWVMWFAPERVTLPSGMISYPVYDGAMFLAFLSIVPSMAIFIFSVETRFYEQYLKFYDDIRKHADLDRIRANHQKILASLGSGFRNLIVLQALVSFMTIILAPQIFVVLGIDFLQLGVFRFGVLGAFFHVLMLAMTIVLAYFDLRAKVLGLHLFLLITNTVFTMVSLELGFPFYGYGYFLSTLLSFALAALVTFREVRQIPYLTFVRNPSAA